MTPVDLTNCDQEPIHTPDSVQAHGFLLGLAAGHGNRYRVVVASENTADYLRMPLSSILGQELNSLLSMQFGGDLEVQGLTENMESGSLRFLGTIHLQATEAGTRAEASRERFQVIGHRSGDLVLLEFERLDGDAPSGDLNSVISEFVSDLEEVHTIEALSDLITCQIRSMTGFDRVMLYRFDEDGHGIVLSEDRNDRLPSYLGLRFPASDIPRQARALYVMNRLRIIPNVDYNPSTLRILPESGVEEPVDLSMSVLRSVSPVHREYMRNMGTVSSMSISIVMEGKLWGLISGHHSEPRTVPYLVRSACDVLSRILSTQLLSLQRSSEMSRAVELKSVHGNLLAYMAAANSYLDGISEHQEDFLALTGATGAAVVAGDRCLLLGDTPEKPDVLAIADWFSQKKTNDVFVTDALASELPGRDVIRRKASGLLAISLSQVHRMQMLWFRPEVIATVEWAGEPNKVTGRVNGALHLHPRTSFSTWKEIVHGRSEPWQQAEIAAALEFRNAVLEIVLKRAEELAQMAADLESSNRELEAFSYSVSHDLRAPFRHISGFAELLLQNESERLSETGHRHLQTIAKSAQFAGVLVDSLIAFAQISRTKINIRPFAMQDLVSDAWRDLTRMEPRAREVELRMDPLPTVCGDVGLLRQVWANLLSNAVKYSRKVEHPRVTVSAEQKDGEWIFTVQDNGVGFDGQYAHKLFGAFQRLHRIEDFEGTGIGLANVRRIVSRHGGRTWANGKEGQGASFYFTLPTQLRDGESYTPAKAPIDATRAEHLLH